MQGNFIKDKEKFLLLLKKIYFHCLNHMCLIKMNGKKKIFLVTKNICQKLLSSVFQKKKNQTELSKKENRLNRDFGYENIDELLAAFNNTKTNEERDKLFDKTKNKLNIFKKLNITVSDVTERKGTNNVIDSVRFVLD